MTPYQQETMVHRIGWFAAFMAIAMYSSYIDQIMRNLTGHPGSIVLPITTVINCSAWTLYGWLKLKKDWPIILCNVPGILLGAATAITAICCAH